MESTNHAADEIRRQMQCARQRVRNEVEEVVQDAKQFADWRFYPRRFPWATLGVAAAVGYALIPRRLEILSPDVDTLQELARQHRLVVENKPAPSRKRGLLDAVLSLTGRALLRAGVAYASQYVGKRFDHAAGLHEEMPA
jgi:hypothetical protein